MRGIWTLPKPAPAQACETRTQHELFSSFLPCRSHGNWTFTRPYLSVQISSPAGPVTIALSGPAMTGFGVTSGGRNGIADGWTAIVQRYGSSSPPDEPVR
jgi:hypothetical protein